MSSNKAMLLNKRVDLNTFLDNFNEITSRELGMHRRELGLSREQVADFFHVNISTVRKWECGLTHRCQERHACQLLHFIKGDYDNELQNVTALPGLLAESMKSIPMEVGDVMMRSIRIYQLLQGSTARQQAFISSLKQANNSALKTAMGARQ